jgi:5-methylcytosine-specific restriction endonuclease McrBC GTP-binding regulatory subunit McrB
MFLNANTGAKLAQQYAAQILAKKRAKAKAEAKANGLELDENPGKKSSKKSQKPNDGSTDSTWLSERNEKERSDAIENVQSAIWKQDERKGMLSSTMEHLVEVAQARLQCSNERGMYTCTLVCTGMEAVALCSAADLIY